MSKTDTTDYWDTEHWHKQYWHEVEAIRSRLGVINSENVAELYVNAIMRTEGYRDILLDCFCSGLPPARWSEVYDKTKGKPC